MWNHLLCHSQDNCKPSAKFGLPSFLVAFQLMVITNYSSNHQRGNEVTQQTKIVLAITPWSISRGSTWKWASCAPTKSGPTSMSCLKQTCADNQLETSQIIHNTGDILASLTLLANFRCDSPVKLDYADAYRCPSSSQVARIIAKNCETLKKERKFSMSLLKKCDHFMILMWITDTLHRATLTH